MASPVDADRRRRFSEWFAGKPMQGDRAKLMQATKLTKGRIAQLLDPDQPFGEKAAHSLAERLRLPRDQFTRDAPSSMTMGQLNGFEGQLISLFRQLTPEQQDQVLMRVNDLVSSAAKTPSTAAPYAGKTQGRDPRGMSVFGDLDIDLDEAGGG